MFHPEKFDPDFVIVPTDARVVVAALPFAVVVVGELAPDPPLTLYVIVEFHCAYSVISLVGVYVALTA
ncbi:unannotated protein [freshwater metagenome]|uniref:Unannotated protein n=1 Tax=freshwater metagenome TaxID=449393 RepID=A0A6J6BWU1_9ZZZZ